MVLAECAIPDFCKRLKDTALHSSVLSFSLTIILRCKLHSPWTGSYCRCRGSFSHCMPLNTSLRSDRAKAVTAQQPHPHTDHYSTTDTRASTSTATDSPGMFPFSPAKDIMQAQQIKLLPVCRLVLLCVGCWWKAQHQAKKKKNGQNGGMFAGKSDIK